jgi:hypothetical protein
MRWWKLVKCCACNNNEELPEGTMLCSECQIRTEGSMTLKKFLDAVKCLEKINVIEKEVPIKWYYPSETNIIKKWFGVKLETDDCVEKGIRFVKIPVIERNYTDSEQLMIDTLKITKEKKL